MRYITIIFLSLLANLSFGVTPAEALKRLVEGNQRYVNDQLLHPNHSSDRRDELTAGQKPFAVVVACSDSRVAPEIIFDQGLGDLFIVRVAGNVVGPVELDSIEYGVQVLGASLVLVVGHESCGAVKAVMAGQTADIEDIARLIEPSIKGVKTLEDAVKANARGVVAGLKQGRVLKRFISSNSLNIVGGYYDLGSGTVEILK